MIRTIKKTVLRAEIVLGLAFARALIKFAPLRWWRGLLGPVGKDTPQQQWSALTERERKMASDIGRMVQRIAGKQKFEAVCFPQALAARWALGRRGIASQVVLGSRRDDSANGLSLHAWLKVDDIIVTGAEEYETYRSFSAARTPPAAQD